MIEHSGGPPRIGTVPAPAVRGVTFVSFEIVPVTEWQSESIDRIESLRELQARDGDVLACGIPEVNEAVARAVWKTIAAICSSPNRALAVDQIKWACGLAAFENHNLGELARVHGLSKQAFQQGAEQYRDVLPGMRSQSARTEQAREKMSLRNYRAQGIANCL
jgi:hypothetical protein